MLALCALILAQDITGTVVVPKGTAKKVRAGKHYPTQAGQGGVYQVFSPAVVYIERVEGDFPAPQERPKINQKNLEFSPRVLPILRGTSVEFPNLDELYHNVFSFSSARKFDLGRYPSGESKSETFDRPGVVKVYCEIHEHMRAFVLVLQNPYFALCDEQGRYTIRGVPPGRHVLKVWQEDSQNASRDVAVESGKPAQADFQLARGEGSSRTVCLCQGE